MEKFSTLVYKKGGDHQAPGCTYGYKQAKSKDELDELLKAGYCLTMPEALEGKAAPKEDEQIDDSPATRKELETKAKYLGIAFRSNTKDETISNKIDEALAK